MSIIDEIAGKRCTIDCSEYVYSNCYVEAVDDHWIKIIINDKKYDVTKYISVMSISEITVDE